MRWRCYRRCREADVTSDDDLAQMSLSDLRDERVRLQADDDRVSYARRAVQSRLDIVRAEQDRRAHGGDAAVDADGDVTGGLRRVLSQQLTGGPARPPRDDGADIASSPEVRRLDELCAAGGFSHLAELDDASVAALEADLAQLEREVSSDRRERFARIDALSGELVRRYRDGAADIDGVSADDLRS